VCFFWSQIQRLLTSDEHFTTSTRLSSTPISSKLALFILSAGRLIFFKKSSVSRRMHKCCCKIAQLTDVQIIRRWPTQSMMTAAASSLSRKLITSCAGGLNLGPLLSGLPCEHTLHLPGRFWNPLTVSSQLGARVASSEHDVGGCYMVSGDSVSA
jgi:hypothetical protein